MVRTFGIFISAVVVVACGVNSPTSQTDVSSPGNPEALSAPSNEATNEATSEATSEAPADESLGITEDGITPAACHVNLNFCNAPGATGTDCTESGCSLSAAISACKSLVSSVGCTVLCNAVMRDSTGAIISTWRQSCGSTCCPENTFCFGTRCCPNSGGGVGCPS